jgi:hypothetical protein
MKLNLAAAAVICLNVLAADFTVIPVGAFGEKMTQCKVAGFRLVSDGLGASDEYKARFTGLSARDLPDGTYDFSLQCAESSWKGRVTVSEFDRFSVVTEPRAGSQGATTLSLD